MDPLSLVAIASSAFKGLEVLVSKGAEIEHVAKKLGHWYGLVADIREAEKEAENPPLFKKLFDGESVEQQALNAIIAKKKTEEMEKQVRELIIWAYGDETYKEMMAMRREIRARRDATIYKQRRKQRMMLDIAAGIIGAMVSGGVIWALFSIVNGAR